VKKLAVESNVIPKVFEILKNNHSSPEIAAYCCKCLNQLLAESENTVPSKKELAGIILEAGGISRALAICATFSDKEEVIEQWFPLIDSCLEVATKLDSLGTLGIDQLLTIIPHHRFVIQVSGASILSRLAESDDYAKHLTLNGGVPVLVKILSTESNLNKYEQKSREVCIKCLNRCAAYPEGIEQMKACSLPKALDSGMRGYGTFFIIQIQGILLIKALAKDEGARKMLVDINVCSLLNFAASKHTVTRLQNLVKEMKENYPGF